MKARAALLAVMVVVVVFGIERALRPSAPTDGSKLSQPRTVNVDDVESITGLMAAWVKRRSVEAALIVETLLKRVVDDMRANNADVHVTSRMYTIVSIRNR